MEKSVPIHSLTLKELSYYMFFVLMLASKGLGLDSGDKLYYILSLIALAAVACKLCMTEYSFKEMAVIGILLLIAFFAYRNSGRLGIVLSVLAIVGMKDMEVNKLFRLGLGVFAITFAVTVLGAAYGIIPNPLVVHEKGEIGEVIRWGMGYSTGNVFHISYFILVVLAVYNMRDKYGLKALLWLMAGNIVVFIFSLSYTGIAVTAFYLLLNLYAVKRKRLCRVEKVLSMFPLPLCLLFSFIMPFYISSPIGRKLDSLLQARLSFSNYFLTSQSITPLGTRMKDVPYFWVIMDNGYVYILMTFGVITLLLFAAAYAVLISGYSKSGDVRKLAVIYAFLVYGIMEQFISNAFMNISLLFIGEILFCGKSEIKILKLQRTGILSGLIRLGEKEVALFSNENIIGRREKAAEKLVKRKTRIQIAGGTAGLLLIIAYIVVGPKRAYAEVPLTALNYIDTHVALFHTEEPYEQKSGLKNLMERYQQIATDETFGEKVLEALEKDNKDQRISAEVRELTPEEMRSMLEFSLPQYVHSSRNYDTFRIRLLESDYSISDETYELMLQEIVKGLEEENEKSGVYSELLPEERIWKSAGTDRIEHITDKELYFIKKDGNIAAVENIRTAIIWMLTGCGAGSIIYGLGIVCLQKGADTKAEE
ncbi:MAG: hypothetical protein GX235_07815 [Clostridiales bacterium]|nr:hypothetical protein [Clostridiales bacterium]